MHGNIRSKECFFLPFLFNIGSVRPYGLPNFCKKLTKCHFLYQIKEESL